MNDPFDINLVPVSWLQMDARRFWPREVDDFALWVITHLDDLSVHLGMTLTFVAREVAVGDFKIDVEVRDERGRKVLIEIQFGPTDHRHLGQIVTYACAHQADAIVWLVAGRTWRTPSIRDEHATTLRVLNRHFHGSIAFYAVEVELSSEPHLMSEPETPLLPRIRVVVRPEPAGGGTTST